MRLKQAFLFEISLESFTYLGNLLGITHSLIVPCSATCNSGGQVRKIMPKSSYGSIRSVAHPCSYKTLLAFLSYLSYFILHLYFIRARWWLRWLSSTEDLCFLQRICLESDQSFHASLCATVIKNCREERGCDCFIWAFVLVGGLHKYLLPVRVQVPLSVGL